MPIRFLLPAQQLEQSPSRLSAVHSTNEFSVANEEAEDTDTTFSPTRPKRCWHFIHPQRQGISTLFFCTH
jgi:hypothetical protein